MGNYERTLNRISEIEDRISHLKDELVNSSDEEERADLSERIYELELEKGENKGYLEELASMDGYNSYSEMCEDCGCF